MLQTYACRCDINTLTCNGVLAGYPDRTYKPALPILRSELATAIVAGLNMKEDQACGTSRFKDVNPSFWAKHNNRQSLYKRFMTGYTNNKFKPKTAATRAEALTAMSQHFPDAPCDPCTV